MPVITRVLHFILKIANITQISGMCSVRITRTTSLRSASTEMERRSPPSKEDNPAQGEVAKTRIMSGIVLSRTNNASNNKNVTFYLEDR